MTALVIALQHNKVMKCHKSSIYRDASMLSFDGLITHETVDNVMLVMNLMIINDDSNPPGLASYFLKNHSWLDHDSCCPSLYYETLMNGRYSELA